MSDQSAQRIWEAALGQLQLQVTRPSFDTWLKETVGLSFQDDCLMVGVPTPFAAEWLERRMCQLIEKTLDAVVRRPVEVGFQVHANGHQEHARGRSWNGSRVTSEKPPVEPWLASQGTLSPGQVLNARYTFDTFVVGQSNRLAHAAAQAVASQPGTAYNPLFIYAGVGLGKTHLLHAIAHEVARKNLDVLYVTTEQFTNDFISAIRRRTTSEFRQKYRSVDVLLIDDIHFIGGKEQTQEGFFHTFNDLHNTSRQIVITSDCHPSTLTLLEDRLRSRFQWGLAADIQPPDLETRLAILRNKTAQLGVGISDEVLYYVAQRIHKNIRELEGNLNRVVAFAQLTNSNLTLEVTAQALADVAQEQRRRTLDPNAVVNAVASHYHLAPEILRGKSREKETALARHVAMYLLREDAHRSLPDIGRTLGNRDHSTVIHALRKIARSLDTEPDLRQALFTIRETLLNAREHAH